MAKVKRDAFLNGFEGGESGSGNGGNRPAYDYRYGNQDDPFGVNKVGRAGNAVLGGKNQLEQLADRKAKNNARDKNVSQSAAAMGNDLLNQHRDKRTDEVYNYGKGGARDYARKITQEQNAMGMTRNEKGRETTDMYRSLGKIGPEYAHNKYSRTSRKANEEANKINNIDRDNEEARFTQPGRPMRNYLESQKQRAAAKNARADVKATAKKK